MRKKFDLKVIYGKPTNFLNEILNIPFIQEFGGNYVACNIVSEKQNFFYSSTTSDILRDAISNIGGVKFSPIRKNLQRLKSTQILTYDDITIENESDAIGMGIRRNLGFNSLASYNIVNEDYVYSLNITSSKKVNGMDLIINNYDNFTQLFLNSHFLLLGELKKHGARIHDR